LELMRALVDRRSTADLARQVRRPKVTLLRWRNRLAHALRDELVQLRQSEDLNSAI
jgi:hypothetical protein